MIPKGAELFRQELSLKQAQELLLRLPIAKTGNISRRSGFSRKPIFGWWAFNGSRGDPFQEAICLRVGQHDRCRREKGLGQAVEANPATSEALIPMAGKTDH